MAQTFRLQKKFLVLIVLLLFLVRGSAIVRADDPTPTPTPASDNADSKINDLRSKISDLENKISGLKDQEKGLSSAISVMDNQITLTQYRMDETQQEMSSLTSDILVAQKKIVSLDGSLNDITKSIISSVRERYRLGNIQPAQILFTSKNINNYVTRLNYLRIIQARDRQLIYDTQQAKNDYSNQKDILETKKQKVEALKKQLEDYTTEIAQQKKDKVALLAKTKNDDTLYQQQLEAARAEQSAIQQIDSGGGDAVPEGAINQGDVVGYMIIGKSACSSGTHLHYEVHKDGNVQDAAAYLANKSVIFENSPDSSFSFTGSYDFPLADPVRIEQGYGMTYWARTGWYGGGPHTGIDMYSDTSAAVHAVKPGKLYRGSIACGGGQLLYARVDQDDGVQSLYLHIVP